MSIQGWGAVVRRRQAGAVVVAAASLAIAGCGGGTTAGAGASDLAGFIPAGAPIYAEVSTDAAGAQWTQALALAKKFPGYEDGLGSITKALADERIDFETQIKPVLGTAAAIGMFDVSAGSDDEPTVVAVVDIADGKDAQALELVTAGPEPLTKNGQHAGIDLYTGDETAAALVDGTLLLSDTTDAISKAIDAHNGGDSKTMAGSDRLDEAFAALPDEVLAQAFVDVGAIVKLAAASDEAKALSDRFGVGGIGADASLGISLSAESDGVRLKAVGNGMGALAGTSTDFTPALTARVPADAVAYVGLKNVYQLVELGLKQAGAQGGEEFNRSLGQASALLPLLGVTLDDVKALTSLEHAFVVTKGATPGVVAALEVQDGAKASTTLDALRKAVPPLLSGAAGTTIPAFSRVDLANGVSGWRSAIDPKAGVVYGVDGNLAVIGTLVDAVRQVQSPSAKLADDAAFQAATRQMPAKVGGLMWINADALMSTLDTVGVLNDVPKDVLANVRPLKNLAAWSTGGDRPTFEAFLTIK